MNTPLEQIARVLIYEAFQYRRWLIGGFLLVNLVALGLALAWPPTYQSSTTIIVEQKNTIQPLMQGAAVGTDVRDHARIAREIIFNRKVMISAMEHVGLLHKGLSDIEHERLIEAAKERTRITTVGQNLVRIEHKDRDPQRAFSMAQKFGELFVSESLGSQAEESQAAFDFIDNQVKEYHAKLTQAEEALKEFRSKHIDARPGTDAEVSRRIDNLQSVIERTTLEIKEAKIKEASLEKQLSGEAEVSINLTRESQYASRIAELQSQLETLRLTYHDTYPDIVRLKHQIEDLREAVNSARRDREEARRSAKGSAQPVVDENVRINPIYQQLKQQLFDTRTNIETLAARLSENKLLLRTETERATRVHGGEATLAELTRDYEVNRDIYQDLLRRRESARVSRNMDRDRQELTLRIHEPAFLPVQPGGVRMLHVVLAGLLASIVLPLGALYGMVQLDPRVRLESTIANRLKLPVVAVVPHLWLTKEQRALDGELQWMVTAITITVIALGIFGALRAIQVF